MQQIETQTNGDPRIEEKRKKKKTERKRYDFKWANKLYQEKTTAAMGEVEYVSVFPFHDNNAIF